jgi:heme-degrading monooxygenase HmoA
MLPTNNVQLNPLKLVGVFSMSEVRQVSRIARIWRGRTTRERADEYEAYNFAAGIKPLMKKAIAVQTFREDRERETEFMTISYWESRDAMTAFTGGEPTAIHHLDRDAEFLIELPKSVQILELRSCYGSIAERGFSAKRR